MNVWRVKLNPDSTHGINSADFCIGKNIVGIGWPVDEAPKDKEEYFSLGKAKYTDKWALGWRRATNDFILRMDVDDLVWVRSGVGEYYLGRIKDVWEYRGSKEYQEADVVNVRSCPWFPVGTLSHVPGKISASFRAGSTMQRVIQESAIIYSKYLFNQLIGSEVYSRELKPEADIFSLLSDEDLEDLVGLYLQLKLGYLIWPGTCKRDTPLVEFELVSKDGKIKASAQVKSGETVINMDDFVDCKGLVYLFAACEQYIGTAKENFIQIPKADLDNFMHDHEAALPRRIQEWMKYVKDVKVSYVDVSQK